MAPLAPMLLLLLLAAPAGAGDLYRWVDDEGRTHFTDDLTRVPARYRDRAGPGDFPASRIIGPAAPGPTVRNPEPAPRPPEKKERHLIRVEKAGLEVIVGATLDGRVDVPFKVDTGAMINTVPRWVADDLGMAVDEDTRMIVVVGVGGQPIVAPVIRLRQVEVGGAVVEDMDAAVLDTMDVGLLGMPFFRHFRVNLDLAAGILELEEVDLSSVQGLYGGYPESYWRGSFAMVAEQLDRIAHYRRQIPTVFEHLHGQLDRAERYWLAESDRLDVEASRAGVPRAWRD